MTADRRIAGWADSAARSRREFLSVLGAGLLSAYPPIRLSAQSPDSLPGTGPSGKLWDPSRAGRPFEPVRAADNDADRKSTRLNSSHSQISYAVFCLKKKKTKRPPPSDHAA